MSSHAATLSDSEWLDDPLSRRSAFLLASRSSLQQRYSPLSRQCSDRLLRALTVRGLRRALRRLVAPVDASVHYELRAELERVQSDLWACPWAADLDCAMYPLTTPRGSHDGLFLAVSLAIWGVVDAADALRRRTHRMMNVRGSVCPCRATIIRSEQLHVMCNFILGCSQRNLLSFASGFPTGVRSLY